MFFQIYRSTLTSVSFIYMLYWYVCTFTVWGGGAVYVHMLWCGWESSVRSAEYAVRAHVPVLAWDRISLYRGIRTKTQAWLSVQNPQARLCSCSSSSKSTAFLYFSNPMYWRYDRSLGIVESRCAANLLGSVTCCAEGGRFILLYMISRFTSWINSKIAFLDDLSWTCSIREGCGMLKIILVCPSSIRGTSSVEMSFKSEVRLSAKMG